MSKEWKLVPVEPTDDMKEAGAPSCEYTGTVCAALCYEAMIAAAPVPPRSGVQPVAWLTSDGRQLVFEGVLDQSQYIEQGMRPLVHAANSGEVYQLREAYVAAGEREHALREELAKVTEQSNWRGEMAASNCRQHDAQLVVSHGLQQRLTSAQVTELLLTEKLAAAEQRNSELIAAIVSLPDEFKELSGCENTAGVYACIDYISDWVAELAKPTVSGASA